MVRGAEGSPRWPQLPQGRTLLTHQGRGAIAAACGELGLGAGDEILVPAYNCGTEVDALLAAGAVVVLYRVDDQGGIDVEDLRRRMTSRTRAVYVIHYFGWPQDLTRVRTLCIGAGLPLVEDCALALYSERDGVPVGHGADAAIFSFPKTLPVPDGGALVLRDAPSHGFAGRSAPSRSRILRRTLGLVRRRLRTGPRARSHGRAVHLGSAAGAGSGGGPLRPDMPPGYYWDGPSGAWGVSRVTLGILRQIDPSAVVTRRRSNYERLLARIGGLPGLRPLHRDLPAGVCPLELPVVVVDRDGWVGALLARGVVAIPWWAGYHRALPWDEFPDACRLKDSVLALPINQDLDDDDIDHVADQVTDLVRRAAGGG